MGRETISPSVSIGLPFGESLSNERYVRYGCTMMWIGGI